MALCRSELILIPECFFLQPVLQNRWAILYFLMSLGESSVTEHPHGQVIIEQNNLHWQWRRGQVLVGYDMVKLTPHTGG